MSEQTNENETPETWGHAGEDYTPAEIGIEGLDVADEKFVAEVITQANAAVEEKKNAKTILATILESVRIGRNLFK